MDDYSMASLNDSRNEWSARLLNVLTPCIIVEISNIFKDAYRECIENEEEDKYLMTFQVCLSGIPKWNKTTVEEARKKISEKCKYLEELITCVHIIQLKTLTCVRVCQKQKKVDIDIPSVDNFIHKVFSNVARKLYTNIYLFEKNIPPLQIQKNNRELELIIKECILNTVRETMPVDAILRAYMDETEDQSIDVKEEVVVENMPAEVEAKLTKAEEEKKAEIKVKPVVAAEIAAAAAAAAVDVPETPVGSKVISVSPSSDKQNKSVDFSSMKQEIDYNGNKNVVLDSSDSGMIKIGNDVNMEYADISDLENVPPEIVLDSLPF
jgi:hypothetical protein